MRGAYKKARAGELKNFTGIDSPETDRSGICQHRRAGAEEATDEILFSGKHGKDYSMSSSHRFHENERYSHMYFNGTLQQLHVVV